MSFYDPGGNHNNLYCVIITDGITNADMLSNLARYTYTTERFFEAGECVPGNGTSLHIGTESLITALLVVNDTSAQTLDTLHGKVEFICTQYDV